MSDGIGTILYKAFPSRHGRINEEGKEGGREGGRGAYRRGVVGVLAGQHVGKDVADGGREDGHQNQGTWEGGKEGGREEEVGEVVSIKKRYQGQGRWSPLSPSLPPFLAHSPMAPPKIRSRSYRIASTAAIKNVLSPSSVTRIMDKELKKAGQNPRVGML